MIYIIAFIGFASIIYLFIYSLRQRIQLSKKRNSRICEIIKTELSNERNIKLQNAFSLILHRKPSDESFRNH